MTLSPSARFASDPFSEVLAALGTRSVRGTSLTASGDWALTFDGRARLKFVAVTLGQCWLLFPGRPPEALTAGDVFLLSNTPYTVASSLTVEPTDGMALYAGPGQDFVRLGEGCETALIGGGSGFAGSSAAFVFDALPTHLRIDRASPGAEAVTRTIKSMQFETEHGNVGSSLVKERLAEILVVEAVRAYIATSPSDIVSWITALADRRIGTALRLMHGDVARHWTVPMLAVEVGMSRSAFTERFATRVGRSPMDYLTHWRMVLAQRKLDSGHSVSAVAEAVGYSSQSAFAHAFKRIMGRSPRYGSAG